MFVYIRPGLCTKLQTETVRTERASETESENICRIAIRAIDLVCTVRRFGSDVDICLELEALLSETFRFVQSGRLMLK